MSAGGDSLWFGSSILLFWALLFRLYFSRRRFITALIPVLRSSTVLKVPGKHLLMQMKKKLICPGFSFKLVFSVKENIL